MTKKIRVLVLLLIAFASESQAYDGQLVNALLRSARGAGLDPLPAAASPVPAAGPPGPAALAAPPAVAAGSTPSERLQSLNKAYADLVETCEGRFGVLNTRLRKQTIRAETISIVGGLIGVLGAVATCPHCAALASGLAGLANPLQQTFKESSDTPQDTKAELIRLSDVLRSDLEAYRNLPPPTLGDASFEVNLARRIDALQAVDSSCRFYTGKAASAGEGDAPVTPKTTP